MPVEREHEIKKPSFTRTTPQFNSRNGQTIFAFPSSTPQLMGPFSFSRMNSPGLVSNQQLTASQSMYNSASSIIKNNKDN